MEAGSVQALRIKSATNIDVFAFLDPRDFLQAVYEQEKSAAKKYSYERFSARLGLGSNAYSFLIISGRRPLTSKAAKKIAKALELLPDQEKYFLAMCRYCHAKTPAERDQGLQELLELKARNSESDLEQSQMKYFSEWFHVVIRELAGTPDFADDPKWIADRTLPRISVTDATYSLELLKNLQYIAFNADKNCWEQTQARISSGSEVRSLTLQRLHRQMAQLAMDAVMTVESADREFGGITATLTEEEVFQLKMQLQAARKKIVEDILLKRSKQQEPDNTKQRVYQINFQMFPLTRKT